MGKKSSRALWAAKLSGGRAVRKQVAGHQAQLKPYTGTILGIDPSLRGTGLAVLSFEGGDPRALLSSTTVRSSAKSTLPECLGEISRTVEAIVESFKPDAVAVEETIYVQNFRTAQILGAARGAAIGAVARSRIPVFEYSPLRIKQAVVGFGRSSKEQVGKQIQGLLHLPAALPLDESDAAAAAYCHAITRGREPLLVSEK